MQLCEFKTKVNQFEIGLTENASKNTISTKQR